MNVPNPLPRHREDLKDHETDALRALVGNRISPVEFDRLQCLVESILAARIVWERERPTLATTPPRPSTPTAPV